MNQVETLTVIMSSETNTSTVANATSDLSLSHAAAGSQSGSIISWRRAFVLFVNVATMGALVSAMATLLATSGWTFAEVGMLIAFAATVPWLSLGFWNAIIGFVVGRVARDPAVAVAPAWKDGRIELPVISRTAVCLTIRNEQPSPALARLEAMQRDLDATRYGSHFNFHVLSDSSVADIVQEEQNLVDQWCARASAPYRIHYRRRSENVGYKAGNIRDFCVEHGDEYDLFIPLDADSLMSASAILRLVRCMQAHPNIGILQSLVIGAPASSLFARVFQFGMRHGMRCFTLGSAWWQADCGPYWGHNAIVRMKPFRDYCVLPILPGEPPLGGHVLSHDQLEAVLMRRAGYEVRVVAEEDDSFEENPLSLPDFIKRDLRWCQGNMQYFHLLGLQGLHFIGRLQLLCAILMYTSATAWMLFIIFGVAQSFMPPGDEPYPTHLGLMLFAAVVVMNFLPKLLGVLEVMLSSARRKAYGGAWRTLFGSCVEFVFSILLAPVVSFAVAVFMAGLIFGRRISWNAQPRYASCVTWRDAIGSFWPHIVFGGALLASLAWQAPAVLPWASPMLIAFLGVVPFALITASANLGQRAQHFGLCLTPEENNPPEILRSMKRIAGHVTAAKGDAPGCVAATGRPTDGVDRLSA